MAGPAFLERSRGDYLRVRGGTGWGVRLIAELGRTGRLNFDLSDEHELIRRTVREFAETKVAPVAEELDREERFPYELVAELGELGLMGLPIPEEYGGAGADTRLLRDRDRGADAHRLVGRDHPRGAHLARDDADPALRQRGAEAGVAAAARRRAAGSPRSGSPSRTPAPTRARRAPRRSCATASGSINGSKIFITNAGTDISACVTITARTGEDEISNLIVPNGTPGYEISGPMDKLGWHASDTRELSFQVCAVPEENLLGDARPGFGQFLEILDGGRISVAAMGVGLAQGAYDLAAAYAKERQQFGRPIASSRRSSSSSPTWRRRSRPAASSSYRAAWLKDAGKPFALEAAMAKLYTGELSNRVVNSALQIHGGYGFMEEFAISRLYRDQKILEIGEGTNEVQRMVIAKQLGF